MDDVKRQFHEEAEALLARCDNSAAWVREWAELHDRWGIECYNFSTWKKWADAFDTNDKVQKGLYP